jgi:hypothetical protein
MKKIEGRCYNTSVKSTKIKSTEKETQATILHYLSLKKYVFWRANNTPVYDPSFGGFRRMSASTRKGIADIYVLRDGVSYFIEVKGQKGILSPEQKLFKTDVEGQKGIFILARSIDDVVKAGL